MSDTIRGLNSVPPATTGSGYSASPRQVGAGYGGGYGGYTGLDPREELYARQFGDQAKNGNFWRGAALWTAGAALAGGLTVGLERDWTKQTHGSYLNSKLEYIGKNMKDEQLTLMVGDDVLNSIKRGKSIDSNLPNTTIPTTQKELQAIENSVRQNHFKNSYKLDKNPYNDLNKIMSDAHDYAKVQMNGAENLNPAKFAEDVKLTKTTGLAKAGMVAGAVLAGGLLLSHLSATGEGNATTQLARERLAMLKAQEAMAQRGMGQA